MLRLLQGTYYGKLYKPIDGDGSIIDMKSLEGTKNVKFEFKNKDNAVYTGTNQGYIPEIGFMLA